MLPINAHCRLSFLLTGKGPHIPGANLVVINQSRQNFWVVIKIRAKRLLMYLNSFCLNSYYLAVGRNISYLILISGNHRGQYHISDTVIYQPRLGVILSSLLMVVLHMQNHPNAEGPITLSINLKLKVIRFSAEWFELLLEKLQGWFLCFLSANFLTLLTLCILFVCQSNKLRKW